MHSEWFRSTFLRLWKFHKLKTTEPNFLGRTNSVERLSYLVLYLNFKIFHTRIFNHSLDLNVFYMIQEYFSQTFKISSNRSERTWFSGGNHFCWTTELFGPQCCISILKVLRTQFLRHSLGSIQSGWFRSTFLRLFKFPQLKD